MPRRVKETSYPSEAAMCDAFVHAVKMGRWGADWIILPETAGWDLLLVRKADGVQIGVQAKLHLTPQVVWQAVERYSDISPLRPGPDYRAVLVPQTPTVGASTLGLVAPLIGITVLSLQVPRSSGAPGFSPGLPMPEHRWMDRYWHEWSPARREKLPEYMPDVAAGVPGPTKLTEWKVIALRMVALLETRPVTRHDFKALGLDPRRWISPAPMGWLDATAAGYIASRRMPEFAQQHPVVFAQIKADMKKWAPAAMTLPPDEPVPDELLV